MTLDELKIKYDKLQVKYGAKNLDSIYYGGCLDNPEISFVFMNPTGRNIASSKNWQGLKSPWIGTKNVWNLFFELGVLDNAIYEKIKEIKGCEWTEEFADLVYQNVSGHKVFITNLGKCTQVDARPLPDLVFLKYLKYLMEELYIVNPKVIILFGNQVSSIVLNRKISVSKCRREKFNLKIKDRIYPCFCVYYPVGNGAFNVDKAIEDIKCIMTDA